MEPLLLGVILLCLLTRKGLGASLRGDSFSGWSLAGNLHPLPARLASHPRVRVARRIGLVALIAGAALVAAAISPSERGIVLDRRALATMGLSLVILTGFSGQISLGQFGFVLLSGGRRSHAAAGLPVWAAASRVRHRRPSPGSRRTEWGLPAPRLFAALFLAVTTLAFSLAAFTWLFHQSWLAIGGFDQGTSLVIRRPTWFGVDFEPELQFRRGCVSDSSSCPA